MNNIKTFYMGVILFALFAFIVIYAPRIAVSQPAAIPDPFEALPQKSMPNCDKEYRFKYDVEIKTVDDFMLFLLKHQDGELDSYKPVREKLIPSQMFDSLGKKQKVDLEKVRQFVKVLDVEKSMISNTKIYKLDITYKDYDKDSWPWSIAVQMSDKGCVSVVYCGGK